MAKIPNFVFHMTKLGKGSVDAIIISQWIKKNEYWLKKEKHSARTYLF